MRPNVLWVLAAVVLSGCATQAPGATQEGSFEGLSAPAEGVAILAEPLPLDMADGTTLDVWVFRPDLPDPVPVILNYSPYWSNLEPPASTGGDAFSRYLIDHFAPRGYAVALVSVRGTGLSEGCFTIGGPTEIADVDAVATALATQAWANGAATATGKSYDGTVAQMLLTTNNPHVKTIVPVSPISEWYKYNHQRGVPYNNGPYGNTFNTEYIGLTSLQQSGDPRDETYTRTPTRLCDESLDVQRAQYESVATGEYTAYWKARNYTALLPDRVDASVFYVHGLQDWNVKPDHMEPWIEELQARGVTVKMWLGQWAHDYPHRDDWNQTLLRWLDHHLKGIDTGLLQEPLVQVEDMARVWRDEAEWPPARAAPLRLYTTAGARLVDAPGEGSASYIDRRAAASDLYVPFAGLPVDPNGVRRFEKETLPTSIRVTGTPVFHAVVSVDRPRATLTATLLVDGRVVDQGSLDLAHRDGTGTARPLNPNEKVAVAVPLFPIDLRIPQGATVVLALSHAEQSGSPVTVHPNPTGGTVTVWHGEGTYLELPTLADGDVRPSARQPVSVGCWSC